MAGRDMVVKLLGVAEGWDKASKTATAAVDSTTKAQISAQDKLTAAQKRTEDVIPPAGAAMTRPASRCC